MCINEEDVQAIADAVVARMRVASPLPGWPAGRGTLSESETAEYLSIGVEFLRQLRQGGRISHRKIGRRVVYAPADVSAFLDACRSTALNEPGRLVVARP